MMTVSEPTTYTKVDKVLLCLGIVSSLVFIYFVFGPSQMQFNLSGLSEIGNLQTSTGVKRRHARALQWENIKNTSSIYTKDLVYTPVQSSAEVKLVDNRVLVLEPDSLVEFESVNNDNFEITLLKGRGEIRSIDGKKETILKPVKSVPIVNWEKEEPLILPQFFIDVQTWARAQKEYVSKASLAPKVKRLLKVKRIEEILQFSLLDYIVELLPPQVNQDIDQEKPWYELKWSSVPLPGIIYELKVSRTPSFNRSVQQEIRKSQVAVQFLESGKHFWKVIAKHKGQRQETQPEVVNAK